MKKGLIGVGILLVILIGGYLILTFYAVRLIQPGLQKMTRPGFTLEEIKLRATHLSVKGIQYEDPRSKQKFVRIEEIRIYPSLLSLLKRSLHIRELTLLQPFFFFYRSPDGGMSGPWVATGEKSSGEKISGGEEKKREDSVEVQIDRIRIRNGSIDFEDGKVGDPPSKMKMRELDFEMKNIQYPLASQHSPVELNGKIEGRTQEGTIDLKGWIDARTMDMETSLDVRGVEVKTLEPYYRKRVTAEVESGLLDLHSSIVVTNRRIDAPGELDLVNLHIKEGGGTVFWIPAETLVSLLEKKGHRIKARFEVKGNMENPQFNLQETFLTQAAFSLAQALGIPIKVVGEDFLRGTFKGEKGLVEGLRSIEELLKKRKEKKR